MAHVNNWTRKMPEGWMPGCCAICDIPCGREEHARQDCPFQSAIKVDDTKRVCDWDPKTMSCTAGDEI